MKILILSIACFVFSIQANAQAVKQKEDFKEWHLSDKETSGFYGISIDKAYSLLKSRKSETVIVAVIDSGIDTLQEDLKDVLWVNPKEKTGNGIDDDGNGYIDDHYGWNFCGSKEGKNYKQKSLEAARVYHDWKDEFEGKKQKNISNDKLYMFQQWKKAKEIVIEKYEYAVKNIASITDITNKFEDAARRIKVNYNLTSFTIKDIAAINIQTANPSVQLSLSNWKRILADEPTLTDSAFIAGEREYIERLQTDHDNYITKPEDIRLTYTKDNDKDITDKFYGNNNLKAESSAHGTLTAGVIGALRDNAIGSKGIVNNVKIMAVRAGAGGDEYDKDVALAIRYAVDNGAQIINMSFGKPLSPDKQFVDDAVKYAQDKGVLLVHSAGNDAKNIADDVFYPNAVFLDGKKATNFINVGASDKDNINGGLLAKFSNYSKEYVDIFAPGVDIYSTSMNNTYESVSGTSFSGPVVAGVAALLKSYFPKLTPQQIIEIIMTSGTTITEEVKIPGNEKGKTTSLDNLCVSGKIISAYEAVKLALQWESEKKL